MILKFPSTGGEGAVREETGRKVEPWDLHEEKVCKSRQKGKVLPRDGLWGGEGGGKKSFSLSLFFFFPPTPLLKSFLLT